MNRITLLIPLLAVLAFSARAESPEWTITEPEGLDAVVDRYVEERFFPFVYVRLEDREGRLIYERSTVNSELMGDRTIEGDSWIRIWSMSKLVTISVVLDLVEDGVLSLSDRVVDYIPEFSNLQVAVGPDGADLSLLKDKAAACPLEQRKAQYSMTVLDLINHRDGFYYPTTGIDCLDEPLMEASLPSAENSQDLIDRLAGLPLINQPGTTSYYGTGTTVLGLVAERASGKSLKQLVIDRLTGPLWIDGLRYGLPEGDRLPPRFTGKSGAVQRLEDEDRLIFGTNLPGYDPDSELFLGGEGMIATADGYADFLRVILNGGMLNGYRFLEASTIEDMTAAHTQLDSPYGHNGYNLWIANGKQADGSVQPGPLWIGGGYEGTHFWIDPERGFVGVVMSQSFNIPDKGWERDRDIRQAVYERISRLSP